MIIAWRTNQSPETLTGWLDKCKVRWRPADVEVTREELGAGIAVWPKWMGDGTDGKPASPSIVVQEPMTEEEMMPAGSGSTPIERHGVFLLKSRRLIGTAVLYPTFVLHHEGVRKVITCGQ